MGKVWGECGATKPNPEGGMNNLGVLYRHY